MLYFVIDVMAKIITRMIAIVNQSDTEHRGFHSLIIHLKVSSQWCGFVWTPQTAWGANKKHPASKLEQTLMRERFFLKCFADYTAYPNEEWDLSKRKPFICAGTAVLVWRASLRCSYREKLEEIQRIMALIWSQWGGGLSTVSYWPSLLHIHSPPNVQSGEIFYHSINEINRIITILQCAQWASHREEKLSITAWKVWPRDQRRVFPWNTFQIWNK